MTLRDRLPLLTALALSSLAASCGQSVGSTDAASHDASIALSADALVGSWTGNLAVTYLDVQPSDAPVSPRNTPFQIDIYSTGDELVLHWNLPPEGVRVWPDGGSAAPCVWPFVISGDHAVFVSGALCRTNNLYLVDDELIAGEIHLENGFPVYWQLLTETIHRSASPESDIHIEARADFTR